MQYIHGTSQRIAVETTFYGDATFADFAPAPCICLACFNSSVAQRRMYARVYDGYYEENIPAALCYCLTCSEVCVVDRIGKAFFDRKPTRTGMVCYCIPVTCCGPPVIYVRNPHCCGCIPIQSCAGEYITRAPANCHNAQWFICCGWRCYTCWEYFDNPLSLCACLYCVPCLGLGNNLPGIKIGSGDAFAADYQAAVQKYKERNPEIAKNESAVFHGMGYKDLKRNVTSTDEINQM